MRAPMHARSCVAYVLACLREIPPSGIFDGNHPRMRVTTASWRGSSGTTSLHTQLFTPLPLTPSLHIHRCGHRIMAELVKHYLLLVDASMRLESAVAPEMVEIAEIAETSRESALVPHLPSAMDTAYAADEVGGGHAASSAQRS